MPPKVPINPDPVEVESQIDRSAWQKPKAVINKLGDISDRTIADIGAGTGFFTFRLAFDAMKVIALDIDQDMITLIETLKGNLPYNYGDKIEARLTQPHTPNLYKSEFDDVVIINTIAYFADPVGYIQRLYDRMETGGRILVVDFNMGYLPVSALSESERMEPARAKSILQSIGFKNLVLDQSTLDYQYIIIGEK